MAQNTERVQIDLELQVQGLSQGAQEAVTRIEAIERAMEDLGRTGQNTGRGMTDNMQQMSKGFDALSKAGKIMTTAVTVPLLGFATASIKTASEFEYAMSEVQAISNATGEDLERLTEHAKELGRETAFSAKEASEGMKYFALKQS